jgi:plastocyanin
MHAGVVDSRGRAVPKWRVMLHHALFINRGRFDGDRRAHACGPREAEPFYGTAEENQSLALPPGYGYRVRAGDRWRMGWMLMNHGYRPQKVYIRYTATVETRRQLRPVTPVWVSAVCNTDRIYNVAGAGGRGAIDRRDRSWTAPFTGRIVAAEAHAHGGALGVMLREPRCANRRLFASEARYSEADGVYRLSPLLHEPSPESMSLVTSRLGWPISRGEKFLLTARYDDTRPHVKVMAIMHLYIARDSEPKTACGRLPSDVQVHRLAFPGSPGVAIPPRVAVSLSARDAEGRAHPVTDLAGAESISMGSTTVVERGFGFSPRKISVPQGASVTWRFEDSVFHDITLAAGPRGFASPYLKHAFFTQRFTAAGKYSLFCSLHPVDMPQVIIVRPTNATVRTSARS